MKKIYEFEVGKEVEVDDVVETLDEKGEKITVTKKVKKVIPHKFFLRKPSRSINDQAELFNGAKLSEAIKAGFLTVVQLRKRFENDGGTVSDPQRVKYLAWMKELFDLQNDFLKISTTANKSVEQEKEYADVIDKINVLRENMRNFELYQSSLFEQTAETYARNRVIFWYLLHLSYTLTSDNKEVPFFEGDDFETKSASYDAIDDEEDPFKILMLKKFLLLVTLWYTGGATEREDFDRLLKEIEPKDVDDGGTEEKPVTA